MDEGKQINVDLRGVSYIDSTLLFAFYRLQRRVQQSKAACLSIIAGSTLVEALQKEKLLNQFTLCDAPEIPLSTRELTLVTMDTRQMQRHGGNSESMGQEFRSARCRSSPLPDLSTQVCRYLPFL